MRAIFAGGGTGGHFYPAYSIAKELIKNGDKIVFAVKERDMAINLLIDEDIPFVEMDVIHLPRTINPIKHMIFFFKLIKSIFYANRIISDFQPDYLYLTGSYVSFSFVLPAFFRRIPIYIHEPNMVYGIGNFISAFFAEKIFLGLPIKNNRFKNRSLLVGTPIRDVFFKEVNVDEVKSRFKIPRSNIVITCFGGSQGARNINNAIYYYVLENKTKNIENITVIHITGKNNYNDVKTRYEEAGILDKNLIILPYYEDMNEIYFITDLLISRSGASTIAEIIHTKTPAILIPIHHSPAQHQYENARFLFERGCAVIIKDDNMLPFNLIKNIKFLLEKERLKAMKKAFQRIDIPSGLETKLLILNSIRGERR